MNVMRILEAKDTEEFRSTIKDNIFKPTLEIVLYKPENTNGTIKAREVEYYPITSSNCLLLSNANAFGFGVDSRQFLLHCVGRERIQKVNKSKAHIMKTLDKISDVIGEVKAVEDLRKDIKNFMLSVDGIFNLDEKE